MSEARKENNQVEKSIVLSDPQAHVMFTTKELNLDMAGQRGGKSQMIGIIAGEYITQYPKLKGFIGANTYLQLSQSTLIKCFEIWAENYTLTQYDRKNNPYGDYVVDKRPPEHFKTFEQFKDYNNIISFKNGGIIYLGSLDNWKAHDGKEFCWGHLDETKDTREEAIKGVILARLSQSGLYLNEEKKIVYDVELSREDAEKKKLKSFNPCWIHTSPAIGQTPEWLINMFDLTRFEEEIRKTIVKPDDFFYRGFGRKSVTIFSTYHNQKNLPNGYIEGRLSVLSENEAMKLVYGYPFSKTGSEYFPKFERVKHVKKIEPQPFGLKHVTFDFNVVPYMTMLSAQIRYQIRYIDEQGVKHDEPANGRMPIEVMMIEFIKEYCLETPLNTTEQCCKHFIEDNAGNPSLEVFYYGDASGNARIEGLGSLTNYKIVEQHLKMYLVEGSKRVRGVNIGVLTRRDLMNRIFEGKIPEVEIYFDEEMVNTIRDFEYLKLGADGKLKEKAKDKDTGALYEKIGHCFVGETLITTSEGQKRIDQIEIGDFVLTRKGFKKVKNVFNNGIREVAEYEINGRKLVCTDEHKVFTKNRGFVRSSQLTHSDKFVIFDEKESKWQNLQQKKAFFKSLTDLISVFIRPKSISKVGAKSMESRRRQPHTDTFGKRISAKFQKVFTFTTKTKTSQTIQSKILNLLTRNSIQNFTTIKNEPKYYGEILNNSHVQKRSNGTSQKKVVNGTSNIQDERFLVTSENLFVQIAEMILKPISKRRSIVPQNAKSNSIIGRKRRHEQVFDIEVEEEHEYFANGVLVHNCSDATEYLVCEILKHYITIN